MDDIDRAAGLAPTPGYRYADVVGDRLFVAGQVPLDADGQLVGADDLRQQARQCLANLVNLVTSRGFEVDDIHQLTIYVVGRHQHLVDAWEEVMLHFESDVPPATLLGVNQLGYRDQLVEIDAQVQRAA